MTVRPLIALVLAAALLAGCANGGVDAGDAEQSDYLKVYNEALAAYQRGDLDRAEPMFVELSKAVPREADVWFRLGNIYARTKRPDAAVAAYREALLRKPAMQKAWHNMGMVQLRQAGNSFVELQRRVSETDPLFPRSKQLAESIIRLLGTAPGGAGASQ
jgi:Tfp pilus assembly protein PilF